ncbi:MAG: hypothetical protein KGH69_04610 [Candidatus Micrarchaeota archaeon]|nr:hypothetical protein [Candidatus Micrarchaeota archaeon]
MRRMCHFCHTVFGEDEMEVVDTGYTDGFKFTHRYVYVCDECLSEHLPKKKKK